MENINYFFTNKDDGNIAYHVGDKKENVDKNREKLSKKYAFDLEKLIYMNQVHGNNVQIADENSPRLIEDCDGLITNTKGLTLMVMVADCIPIILWIKIKKLLPQFMQEETLLFKRLYKLQQIK